MNSYDTKTWAWEAQINALKSELEVQAAENVKLRGVLEEAARHICRLQDEWSFEPIDPDNRSEWPVYITDALEGK